jgi:hypothetical protein
MGYPSLLDWSIQIDDMTVDRVTNEVLYRGKWYKSFQKAVEAKLKYEIMRDYYLEAESDARRDENDV